MNSKFSPDIDTGVANLLFDWWKLVSEKLNLRSSSVPVFKKISDGKSSDNVYLVELSSPNHTQFWIAKDARPLSSVQARFYSRGSAHIVQFLRDLSNEHFHVFSHAAMRTKEEYKYLTAYANEPPSSIASFFDELTRLSQGFQPNTRRSATSSDYLHENRIMERRTPDYLYTRKTLFSSTNQSINFISSHFDILAYEKSKSNTDPILANMRLLQIRDTARDFHILVFSDGADEIYWIPCSIPESSNLKIGYRYNLLMGNVSPLPMERLLNLTFSATRQSKYNVTSIVDTLDPVTLIEQHRDLHEKNVLFSRNDFLIFDFGSSGFDILPADYSRFLVSVIRAISHDDVDHKVAGEFLTRIVESSNGFLDFIVSEASLPLLQLSLEAQKLLNMRYLLEEFVTDQCEENYASTTAHESRLERFDALYKLALTQVARRFDETNVISGPAPHDFDPDDHKDLTESTLHPKLGAILIKSMTRPGNALPIGRAKRFVSHFLHHASLPLITPLQEKFHSLVVGSESPFESTAHVLVSGPTTCGKTTLADMFLLRSIFVNDGNNARALFLSPTKALAHEKFESLKQLLDGFDFDDDIDPVVISTGDESDSDHLIASGRFRIACTVYEKANILFSRSPAILSQIGIVAIDELHMFMDLERGPMLELIAAKLQSNRMNLEFSTTPTNVALLRPQILGISTDNQLVSAFREPLTIERFNQKPLTPVEIHEPRRPVDICHTLVLPSDVNGEFEEVPIGSTVDNSFPALPAEKRADLVTTATQCYYRYRANEKVARSEKRQVASKESRIRLFLVDLVRKNPFGERILCFVPARNMAESLASDLAKDLTRVEFSESKADTIARGLSHVEEPQLKENLRNYSSKGIFVHHSDLPSMTLRAIEEVCRDSMSSVDRTELIIATQTLSYGVNLAVTFVCICGQMFYLGFRDGEAAQSYLSNCEYHNMVGRCGRFGKTRKGSANAFILFDIFRNTNENALDDFFKLYYSPPPPFDSVVFTAEDEKAEKYVRSRLAFRRGRGSEGLDAATNSELISGVNRFSLPFVRAVLDALRHLNYESVDGRSVVEPSSVTADDITELFDRTPFGKKFHTKDSHHRMVNIFEFILRALKQREYKLIRDASEGEFLITERGDAILNTGKGIRAIQHYQRFIDFCNELFDHYQVDDASGKKVLPYFYLIIVVAQSEVIGVGGQYTTEYAASSMSDEFAENCKKQVISQFWNLLCELAGEPTARAIPEGLLSSLFDALAGKRISDLGEWANQWESSRFYDGYDKIGDHRLLTSAIFRLANFSLASVSGRSSREMGRVLLLSEASDRHVRRFMGKQRFFESISYGITFLAALIRTATDKRDVSSELLADRLRSLAEQIKLGLRAEYLPFAALHDRRITRQDVVSVCKTGLSVSKVLQGSLDDQLPAGITKEDVIHTVTTYYKVRFQALAKVWAEKGRVSDDRLLSNIADMWDCLAENYASLILHSSIGLKGELIKQALNALFSGLSKKIEMNVFGYGAGNVDASPTLAWLEDNLLKLSYADDDDDLKSHREIAIVFVECDGVTLSDRNGNKVSSTELTMLRSDDYWLVNVSPKIFPKDKFVAAFSNKMRLKDEKRLALIELDAFIVLISAILRGFFVSIDEFLEVFNDRNAIHISMVDVVSRLNARETVPQILKATIEYISIWSCDQDIAQV